MVEEPGDGETVVQGGTADARPSENRRIRFQE